MLQSKRRFTEIGLIFHIDFDHFFIKCYIICWLVSFYFIMFWYKNLYVFPLFWYIFMHFSCFFIFLYFLFFFLYKFKLIRSVLFPHNKKNVYTHRTSITTKSNWKLCEFYLRFRSSSKKLCLFHLKIIVNCFFKKLFFFFANVYYTH